MRNRFFTLALAGLVLSTGICRAADEKAETKAIEPEAISLGRPVDFEKDVFPILDANCIACHNLAIKENNLNLEDVPNILKGGKRGPAVVAKDPDKSVLYQMVRRSMTPAMPPLPNKVEAAALTPKEVGIIRQWILEGASAGAGGGGAQVQWHALPGNLRPIYSVAASADGQFAVCGRGNQIFLYHLPTQTLLQQFVDPALLTLQDKGKPMFGEHPADRDLIHSLAISPNGNVIASGGYRTVKLWERPENAKKLDIALGAPATPAMAISADGKWLATASPDNSIKTWSLADGKPGKTLAGHTAAVAALRFSPDGARIYSGSADKTIRIWDLNEGKQLGSTETPAPVTALAINPEGNQLVSGGADNIGRVWAIPADPAMALTAGPELKGHGKPLTALTYVANPAGHVLSGAEDNTVRMWNLSNGGQTKSYDLGAPVTGIAIRPDGQYVAASGANNAARIWKADNGQQLAELKGDIRAQRLVARLTAEEAEAKNRINTTNNLVTQATNEEKTRTDAVAKAKEARDKAVEAVKAPEAKVKDLTDKFNAAKAAADAKTDDQALAKAKTDAEKAVTDATAELKKVTDARVQAEKTVEQSERAVKEATESLAKARTKAEEAVALQKKLEGDLTNAKTASTATEKPIRAIAYSADGKILATGGDDNLVHTWGGIDGAPLEVYTGHQGPVTALAFGADQTLVSGSADQTAKEWELNPAWKLAAVLGPKAETPLEVGMSPFVSRVLALAFSPDGTLLATGGGDPSRSGELMIWDVAKRALVKNIEDAHSDTVFSIEFSPDGKQLASGAADKFVKVFDVGTGKHIKSFEGHTHHVMGVTWKIDASILASAGADNAIKVWNVETGEQQRTIQGYAKQVTSIRFMGRGNNIASCGGDGTVRLHQADNGNNVRNFGGGKDFMYAVAVTPDEKVVVAGGEDGVLRVWNATNAQAIISFDPPKTAAELAAEKPQASK